MPPIAEDMAGGTGQQQQPQRKKNQKQRPPARRESSNVDQRQQHQQQRRQQPQQRPSEVSSSQQQQQQQFLSPDTVDSEVTSSVAEESAEVEEASYSIMQVSTIIPKKSIISTMDHYSADPSVATEFFKKEPCIYSHRMFERASKIFAGLKRAREARLEKRKDHRKAGAAGGGATSTGSEVTIEPMDFKSMKEKKLTYELAFASLKFENVFEDMLEDCAFFTVYPDLKDDECLVMVVLWDYQSRKFQPRIQFDADELMEEVTRIERAILDQKTKLAASLARRRIKESAPTIDYLLPDKLRSKSTAQKPLPVYAWVNTAKISPPELLQKLKEEKFVQLWMPPKTAKEFQEKSFYLDPHCSDVIVFSQDCNTILQEHALVEQGYLVRQDKSSCLAAHSVVHLLGDEQEVVVVNAGSGMTAAHLAVLLKERKCGVVIVSEHSEDDYNKMMRSLELIGVTKYVKVIRETFVDMDPDDARLKGVRAALVTADCSKSAVANIVNYIVTEGENLKLLQDLTDQSEDLDDRMNSLQTNHVALLRHALKLTRIQGVTYLTRSVHDQENDAVVQRAIEFVNMVQMAKKLRPWRVIPPVLPFSSEEIDDQVGIQGKYAFFKPSDLMNGCFIVCIAREPEDPSDAVSRVRSQKVLGAKSSKTKLKSNGSSSESSESGKARKKGNVKKGKAANKVSAGSSSNSSGGDGSPTPTRPAPLKVPEHVKVVKHPAPFR